MSEQFETHKSETPFVKGTIVSVTPKDGTQSGRYQVQLHVSQDSGTTGSGDTIECGIISHDAPFYGIGRTGARYKIGQPVTLIRTGQQSYEIIGANPNARGTEDGQNDNQIQASLPKGLPPWFHRSAPDPKSLPKALQEDYKDLLGGAESFQKLVAKDAVKLRSELETAARKVKRSGEDPIKDLEGIVRRVLRDNKEMGRYAAVAKQVNKSIGGFAFNKGDMKDPIAYMKKLVGKKAELIPNAFQMMEKLKAAAGSGLPIDHATAVGGLGMIQQALAGAAQNRSGQTDDEFDLLEFLCALYEELFPDKKCKDEQNKFTRDFLTWKKAYMLELNINQEALS